MQRRMFQVLIVMLIAGLIPVLSGCAPKTAPRAQEEKNLEKEIENLRKTNERLTAQLVEKEQQVSSIKFKLLEEHSEVDRLTKMNEHLISEFVRNKSTPRSRGDKAETVRLIAEVNTLITTEKSGKVIESNKNVVKRAEKYLAESKSELDKGNVEGAFYLARQALEHVQKAQVLRGTANQKAKDASANFEVPFPMKLITTSNVRKGPSTKEKVMFVLGTGETVDAIGYQGQWINVNIMGKGKGWIHSSLLN